MHAARRCRPSVALLLVLVGAAGCGDSTQKGGAAPDAEPFRPNSGRDAAFSLDDLGAAGGGSDGAVSSADGTSPETDALPFIDLGNPPPRPDAATPPPGQDAGSEPADAAEPPRPPPPDAAEPPPPPPNGACAAALAGYSYDFEAGPQGFEHAPMDGVDSPDWPVDGWAWGRASVGPGHCADNGNCFATGLTQNLVQCQRAELDAPRIDLSDCAGSQIDLVFEHWYSFWTGADLFTEYFDGGTVETSADGQFYDVLAPEAYPGTLSINPSLGLGYSCLNPDGFEIDGLPGFTESNGGWEEVRMPLGDLPAGGPFFLRFAYATGVSQETSDPFESEQLSLPGWFIDRVRFERR